MVLVVEDDAFMRLCGVEMPEKGGLRAKGGRRDANEAWDILTRRDDIGALFTDIDT